MNSIRAAFYARVSSEQQAIAHTINSQLAALSERSQADGSPVPTERQFVDNGYGGATFVRPALDHLRDLVALGGIDRIYVHSPDRLARNYAYQVLLIDEWHRAGVEVIFLNPPWGRARRTTCCCRSKALLRSTSGPRSWNGAGAARSTQLNADL